MINPGASSVPAKSVPENIVDGVTGFVVERRNPVDMVDKITLLTRDVDLRKRMGVAGRKRVLDQFDIETQVNAFVSFST